MKKTIAVFLFLLFLETMAFANTSLSPVQNSLVTPLEKDSLLPYSGSEDFPFAYPTNNTCVVGNANLRTYADQMDKTVLTEQDSFLAGFKKEQEKNLIPSYLRDSNFQSYINRNQIRCAMKRIPNVTQTKKSCSSSNSDGTRLRQTPCVTEEMVNYIYWGLNEAMRCYADLIDSHERKIIFKKLNHESAFGFFFQYGGGAGIAQLIGHSKKDLFLPGYAGNNFLTAHVRNNQRSCENFVRLLNRTRQTQSLRSCEFISVGDGIGRSLIGGLTLYLHYRSDPSNPYSAERLLSYWGYPKTNSEYYKQVRSYLTLGMYNKGPGSVMDSIKHSIKRGSLASKSDEKAFSIVMNLIRNSNFNGYIKGVENSTNQIFDRTGSCKI